MGLIKTLIRDDEGATAIEYGLIAALISVAIIGVLQMFSDSLIDAFEAVALGLEPAVDA